VVPALASATTFVVLVDMLRAIGPRTATIHPVVLVAAILWAGAFAGALGLVSRLAVLSSPRSMGWVGGLLAAMAWCLLPEIAAMGLAQVDVDLPTQAQACWRFEPDATWQYVAPTLVQLGGAAVVGVLLGRKFRRAAAL